MTAPSSPGSGDALHGKLAEALVEKLRPAEPWPGAPSPEVIAAALLPIVREAIADELESVTSLLGPNQTLKASYLRERAARIRADALRDGTRA